MPGFWELYSHCHALSNLVSLVAVPRRFKPAGGEGDVPAWCLLQLPPGQHLLGAVLSFLVAYSLVGGASSVLHVKAACSSREKLFLSGCIICRGDLDELGGVGAVRVCRQEQGTRLTGVPASAVGLPCVRGLCPAGGDDVALSDFFVCHSSANTLHQY